jgi:DNA-binding PadR family transcriptional regulator
MVKRRRVGNLLALAVLATVIQRPMHPYEMASLLRERGKERDMKIKWGSLYTVVQNLEKHGLIEATESVRQGGRPERTIYQITDAGREELDDWARELISTPEREFPRFEAGLSVLAVLPPDEAAGLLRQRLELLEEELTRDRDALAEHGRDVPRLFLVEMEYDIAVRAAEVTWIRSLIDELVSGSFPGIKQWRAWHETGELPPEVAELTDRGRPKD